METAYRFFIGGIIQGSKNDLSVHNQDYRHCISRILQQHFPNCTIFCPVENHPDSISYDDLKAKNVFMNHIEEVKKSHCLIVYLPEASLGTAIEMWEAYQKDIVIITISSMITNWVVRIFSDKICLDMETFKNYVESGHLKHCLEC